MKRILAAFLAAALVFTLCGCGGKKETVSKKQSAQKTETQNNSIYAESYEEYIENMEKFFAGDVALYKTCFPIAYWDYILAGQQTTEKALFEKLEGEFKKFETQLEETYGKNLRYQVKEISKEKLSKKTLEKMGKALNSYCNIIKADLLTAGYTVTMESTVKGDKSTVTDKYECYIVKYDGLWYSVRYSEEENIAFFREP